MVPLEEGITHLYNTRGIVDKWLGHSTLDSIFPDKDLYVKGASPNIDPLGEGLILRWTTRVVLGPGGDVWYPANRKVKLAVFLKELQLSKKEKERLFQIVGKWYNPNNDELTITSERFDLREENRKDILRTLHALIDEANNIDDFSNTIHLTQIVPASNFRNPNFAAYSLRPPCSPLSPPSLRRGVPVIGSVSVSTGGHNHRGP